MSNLETYFNSFRKNIIGIDQTFESPYGLQKIMYADWIASGRLYSPIEKKISETFGPFVGNTHTETSETGARMTHAYHLAHHIIKQHVNAGENDVIITSGSGMTDVINKFQRILGLKYCGKISRSKCIAERERPVVFITHMEHHSNHTSWYETSADVVIVDPGENLLVDPENLRKKLEEYKDRPFKIGSFTACSNVTGIRTPFYELAKTMHEYGGVVFIDFAASAPYDTIDMHSGDPMMKLDAVMFSPHKFLGGPGSSGVLIFDKSMYHNRVPDHPGGGTVDWTNPWGEYKYVENIEAREDGGTPGFLQSIRTALCFELKDRMGVENILQREEELLHIAFAGLDSIAGVTILANNERERLGVISFYVPGIHYNLLVKLLNDQFGIQVRGGCACAGTYGHFLLEVSHELSDEITRKISTGDLSLKPGWVRWSLHPTTTDDEVHFFIDALRNIVENIDRYKNDYNYFPKENIYRHKQEKDYTGLVSGWFNLNDTQGI
ncbi:MAG: selenocysteine lyase [Bacteroidetes bacterium GWF2_42_66]|nr:MAG: selenocysteine lyase [Bacteroidetes bacterium GWA2_42_15]OFX99156.1 MAG: selenocysteine lyase [Bacteroidetes bacterium GWE2_42_39]OFY40552.1 MAG: selenocysteine lyase [Bacteroidetes bacterium GWF2_42_66]HBL74502.1 selenocysteine lyase [Prolixibacteraceae bacterium]HCR91241.1 selenocysteine lyase [Prolixibacteraceae bacterium]